MSNILMNTPCMAIEIGLLRFRPVLVQSEMGVPFIAYQDTFGRLYGVTNLQVFTATETATKEEIVEYMESAAKALLN